MNNHKDTNRAPKRFYDENSHKLQIFLKYMYWTTTYTATDCIDFDALALGYGGWYLQEKGMTLSFILKTKEDRNMKPSNKQIIVLVIASLLAFLFIIIALNTNDDLSMRALFIGIATSLIATVVFWLCTDVLLVSGERDFLIGAINRLESMERCKHSGVLDIRKRNDSDELFWINFACHADGTLTLSGRTLTRWLDGGKKQKALTDALKRIVDENKNSVEMYMEPVRLIIYSEKGIDQEVSRITKTNADPNVANVELEKLRKESTKIKCYLEPIPITI